MQRIDAPGATIDNRFTEGNEASAIPATEVSAEWLNDVQEEVCNTIEDAGLTLDGSDQTQLLQAIRLLIAQAVPVGLIGRWAGSIASIPSGWKLCDGTLGTPNLRDKFVVGAGGAYTVGATGGALTVSTGNGGAHTPNMLAAGVHSHTAALAGSHLHSTNVAGAHSHTLNVSATTLTEAQMPSHGHNLRCPVPTPNTGSGDVALAGPAGNTEVPGRVYSTGGSQSHTHGGTTSSAGDHGHTTSTDPGHQHSTDAQGSHVHTMNAVPDHVHTVSTLPPYYALAYIMKVAA